MAPGSGSKKYEQPYSSRHVTENTADSIRADEPVFIRNFPRFLYALYKKQTPFTINLLTHIRSLRSDNKSSSRKSVSTNSPREATDTPASPTVKQAQPQQPNFKTLGAGAGNADNPSPMSSMPSDFEHIFHYSETQ